MEKYYLLVAAITPSILMLWYFYARDLNRERGRIVGFTFLFGVLVMIPTAFLELWIFGKMKYLFSDPYLVSIINATLAGGFPEELCKYGIVILYAMRHREFDEPMDGIVYGAAASLGFAAIENISLVFHPGYYGFATAIQRALTAVPFHATMGAIMGYFLGQARFQPRNKLMYYVLGLFIPVLLHSFYDYPWITLESLKIAKVLTNREQLVLPWFGYIVLVFSLTWTMILVRRLRKEQEFQASLTGQKEAKPLEDSGSFKQNGKLRFKRKVLGWLILSTGASLSTIGGLFLLSLILFLLASRKNLQDTQTILGALAIGIPSLVLGILFFNRGIYFLRPKALIQSSNPAPP